MVINRKEVVKENQSQMNKKNVLVVSPHPDDMEIGMGGTVAKLVAEGFNVVSFVVTDGRRSTSASSLGEDEIAKRRKMEVEEAARILGVQDLILLGLRDVKAPGNQNEMKEKLDEAINRLQPVELFTTHPQIDKHPTHRAVSGLVSEVLNKRRKNRTPVPQGLWCYEVWTPFERYDRIEDISDYIGVKTAAIDAHKSQIEYKGYTEGIKGLNRYRAVFQDTSGITDIRYAEVFMELRIAND